MDKRIKHGMWSSSEYKSWAMMKHRCSNPNYTYYSYYGGRGITVCKRWNNFKNFYRDMGAKPKGYTLERINNDKGYSKSNCRWASRTEQTHNRRKVKGPKLTLAIAVTIALEVLKGLQQKQVAHKFKCSRPTVCAIMKGKRWPLAIKKAHEIIQHTK